MAFPTCPKCGGHVFETHLQHMNGSYYLVVCSSCGVVVGAFSK